VLNMGPSLFKHCESWLDVEQCVKKRKRVGVVKY
jgi:hypothetical protein